MFRSKRYFVTQTNQTGAIPIAFTRNSTSSLTARRMTPYLRRFCYVSARICKTATGLLPYTSGIHLIDQSTGSASYEGVKSGGECRHGPEEG